MTSRCRRSSAARAAPEQSTRRNSSRPATRPASAVRSTLPPSWEKVHIDGVTVTADVTVNADDTGFNLAVTLKTHVAGVDHATAERLAHKAHNDLCPYSKATRNNIPVVIEII